jgi:hypothetical protein
VDQPQKPLLYNATYTALKDLLGKFGFEHKNFSLHYKRAGGATDALQANVPPSTTDKHGRWKCSYTKNLYNKPDDLGHVKTVKSFIKY